MINNKLILFAALAILISALFFYFAAYSKTTNKPILDINKKSDPLINKTWVLRSYSNPENLLTDANSEFEVTLKFNSDNTVEGFGGCNSYSGKFNIEDKVIHITEVDSTLMYCEETSEQESDFIRNLDNIDSFEVEHNTLTLSKKTGDSTKQIHLVLVEK